MNLARVSVKVLGIGALPLSQLIVFEVGQPQLFVAPAAVFLVAVAYLERVRWNHSVVVLLETTGLLLFLGVTLLQSLGLFTDGITHQWYGLLLFFESLGVILWGLLVQWKRPFFGGIVAFIANLVIAREKSFGGRYLEAAGQGLFLAGVRSGTAARTWSMAG